MKLLSLLLVALLTAPLLANANLVELVTIYGPPEGDEFYHVCGPGDVNQDGYNDFIISSPVRDRSRHECENGYARLYFGGDPIDTSNYITIPAVCNEYQISTYWFGHQCEKVGDINSDGFPDFLIGDPGYDNIGPENVGAGFVYWGGSTIDTLPGWRLVGELWNSMSPFFGLGDIDGDSYNDIVSGSFLYQPGFTFVFLGGESPDTLYDFLIVNPDPEKNMMSYPKIIGDYNGDGKEDLVVCDEDYDQEKGIAYMYFGSEIGFNQPDLVFHKQGLRPFGRELSGCGDLNGDGFHEFMISDDHTVYIYFGSENPDTLPDIFIREEEDTLNAFGSYISGGGDLNQDGYLDIAISDDNWSGDRHWQGRVLIYYGGEDMDSLSDIIVYGQLGHQRLGKETAFPGDINGDGYPEFLASSRNDSVPGGSFVTIYTSKMASVESSDPLPLVREIELMCYPNPFNASTVIKFKVQAKQAKLEIFDLAGKRVKSFNLNDAFGQGQIIWDGANQIGQRVSSGIYFYRLTAGDLSQTKRMLLLR